MCSSILIDYETGAFFDWNNWTVHFDLAHSRCSDHSCRAVSRVGSAHSGIARRFFVATIGLAALASAACHARRDHGRLGVRTASQRVSDSIERALI